MFSLRRSFGIPGVISVIALVFAMLGGAYAATDGSPLAGSSGKRHQKKGNAGLTAKQKKEVKAIAKGFQGTGPAGPQGPAGSAGKDGAQGGKGDTGGQGPQGNPGSPGAQGPTGEPWPAGGTLPEEATETGTFSMTGVTGTFTLQTADIPFAIPLATPLAGTDVHYVTSEEAAKLGAEEFGSGTGELCEGETGTALEDCEEAFEVFAEECPGSNANPQAASGKLCVYGAAESGGSEGREIFNPAASVPGASVAGAVLKEAFPSFGFMEGTWAVTG